jgi:hypothetical protein
MAEHAERLKAELHEINSKIAKLTMEKKEVEGKLQYLAFIASMREIGQFSLKRLEEEMQREALDVKKMSNFVNKTMLAWRQTLGKTFFPHTVCAIPEFPVRLTADGATNLLRVVADALRKDLLAIA